MSNVIKKMSAQTLLHGVPALRKESLICGVSRHVAGLAKLGKYALQCFTFRFSYNSCVHIERLVHLDSCLNIEL